MRLIDNISNVQPLSEAPKKAFEEIIIEHEYPKGHHLLKLWDVDKYFHYIRKGAGRVYYWRDGKDITDYLALDHQFLGGVESLFTHQPSHKAIELLEDSTIESFAYQDFEQLCSRYHEIERLGRKMATFAFLECQKRIEDMRFLSAAERYEELHNKYPAPAWWP